MSFTTVPILFILQIAFWIWLIRNLLFRQKLTNEQATTIIVWLALLISWGVITSLLSIYGVYATQEFLRLLPGFWIPMIPVIITLSLYTTWSAFRAALHIIVSVTPVHTFILIQALRIAAIGGLYKATQGLMPLVFVVCVGIPDFLYGLSALILGGTSANKHISSRALGLWNIIGIGIIVLIAPPAFQLSLPGSLYIFQNLPDGRALLEFPMVLAPTLVVPFFIIINAIVANHLLRSPQ
jgi:hypothetical protein